MAIGERIPKFRRKQYIVSARFQLKYAGIILALMFVTAAISSYVVYYMSMLLMGEKLANVYPQGQLIGIIRTVNMRLLMGLLLMTPVVFALGIYLSHKIAGPTVRLERFLKDMGEGNFGSRIVLRKGDEFMALADGMNLVCEGMKASIIKQRALLQKILDDEVALRSKTQDTAGAERLEKEIIELSKEIEKYKV